MGMYPSGQIGVYIKIPITSAPVTRKVRRKPNGKIAHTKFNPETGQEYPEKLETTIQKNKPTPYIDYGKPNTDGLDEDAFWCPEFMNAPKGYAVFISTESDISLDIESGECKSLENLDPERKILEFKRKYHNYLEYYKEEYGSVELEYGVIVYYS